MKTNTFLRAVVAAVAVMVMAFSPVAAVTDGYPDDGLYPFVGIMVAQTAPIDEGGKVLWRCSGTLLSPWVFLTAGHCTEDVGHVEIWFDANIEEGITEDLNDVNPNGYPLYGDVSGTAVTYPPFYDGPFYMNDLGIVVLDEPFESPNGFYGELPDADQFDYLGKRRGQHDMWFTAVGYGLQASFPDAASWQTQAARIRMVSHPTLIQINNGIVGDYSMLLSNNAHTGGTCFGDSGGPNFVRDSYVIAGITSFGMNGNCAGTGGVYRIDRVDELNWINYIVENYWEFQG